VSTSDNTTEPKVVITCTFCKRNAHDTQGCWDNTENKLVETAKMKNDAEDILKSTHGHKKEFMVGFAANDPDE
jgi:hypothetical protein